jgi:hypothetical protein
MERRILPEGMSGVIHIYLEDILGMRSILLIERIEEYNCVFPIVLGSP